MPSPFVQDSAWAVPKRAFAFSLEENRSGTELASLASKAHKKAHEPNISRQSGFLRQRFFAIFSISFSPRAPENIISHERDKQKNYETDLAKLQDNLQSLQI